RRVAIRGRNLPRRGAWEAEATLPLRPPGFYFSAVREPQGRPGHATKRLCEMAPKDFAGSQSQGVGSHGSIRADEADQLGHQPLGVQTGVWLFRTLGSLGARWLR